ncbi:hypothetical protein ACFLYR_06825 [Chloroflexota bacterium]
MRDKLDFFFTLAIILLFGGALLSTVKWPLTTSLFPFVIGGFGISLAVFRFIALVKITHGVTSGATESEVFHKRDLISFGWIASFFGSAVLLGFQWGLPGIILLYLKFVGRQRLIISILLSAVSWGLLYAAIKLLHLPLYKGLLWQWLS